MAFAIAELATVPEEHRSPKRLELERLAARAGVQLRESLKRSEAHMRIHADGKAEVPIIQLH